MPVSNSARRLLWAGSVPGVGKKSLLGLLRDPQFFRVAEGDIFDAYPDMARGLSRSTFPSNSGAVNRIVDLAERFGDSILCPLDRSYPATLRHSGFPPPLIFVRGNLECLAKQVVTIIGTRHPTEAGKEICKRITSWFVNEKWVVASGLALGLDTVAHQISIENEGQTVALLAHGLDDVYPKSNAMLAAQMLDKGGCLVSEYAYGTRAFKGNFIERDAVQARIALGVVLCQTGVAGGSLYASRESLAIGRSLFVASQSRRDLESEEEKALGNILLLQSDPLVVKQMLKLQDYDPSRVIALNDRDDLASAAKIMQLERDRIIEEDARPMSWRYSIRT